MLMLTIHDDITQRRIIETARLLNPDVEVVMLEDRKEEADHAASDKLGRVFYGPGIVALELVRYAMERFGRKEEEARIEEDKATDAAEKAAH
jgi:CPA2 family monovalent cation:H+ antiporter-2